jgi:dTDP-4-amino-4,6-dideoxygalactose transaminase
MQRKEHIPFLDVRQTYFELRGELDDAISRVLHSGTYIQGEEVCEFELDFASYVEAKYCVGVGNGLDALKLALKAVGVKEGDEVIVPSHTFIATWLAVTHCGAIPIPVETESNGYNVDLSAITNAITTRTKAIIVVHLYGQPASIEEVLNIAHQYDLRVVEDAAQAHGAVYKGRRIGGHSDAVAWSFYPGKNLGAFGDGGAVTTDNEDVAKSIRSAGNYGAVIKYQHDELGTNSRLDPIQAALLKVKLRYLDVWNANRKKIADVYLEELRSLGSRLPMVVPETNSSWHLFVVQFDDRDEIKKQLKNAGIESAIHYPTPPHLQKAYAVIHAGQIFPRSEKLASTVLSLPIGPHMNLSDAHYVSDEILKALQMLS